MDLYACKSVAKEELNQSMDYLGITTMWQVNVAKRGVLSGYDADVSYSPVWGIDYPDNLTVLPGLNLIRFPKRDNK